ncbi:hypothetical protein AMECASPLE_011195 [Ameca splendens]|uniref:Uncharacterized protein n=1 Tax=Ameca splendens TaxID=208324 RepID=A0ABV0YZE8_9TELE
MNLHPSLKSSAVSNRFSSQFVLDLAPSIFPSTLTSFPVPTEVSIPQHGAASAMFHGVFSVRFLPTPTAFCTCLLCALQCLWQTANITCCGFLLAKGQICGVHNCSIKSQ